MEELLENYAIVKGPKSLESEIKSAQPIALKETSFGIEAFMPSSTARKLTSKTDIHIERPNLDEIMYYIVKSKKS